MKLLTITLRSRVALAIIALTPLSALAHPGHGLGPVGHDLQHLLWNFLGMVLLCAGVLILGFLKNKN